MASLPIDTDSPHLVDGVLAGENLLLAVGGHIDFEAGIWTFDVSDPESPVLLGSAGSQQVMSTCWSGSEAWVLQMDGTLGRVDLDAKGLPRLEEAQRLDSTVGRMDCDEEVVAWGTGAQGGAWIFASETSGPAMEIPGDVRDVVLEGEDRLWALGIDRLVAFELDRFERTLTEVGSLTLDGSCHDLAEGEDWLVASCGSAGVHLVDRGEGSPTLLGSWDGYASARTAAVADSHVLVAAWTDLLLLDATDPTVPVLVGTEPAETAIGSVVHGHEDRALVLDWKRPFIARFSDLPAPEVRSRDPYAKAGQSAVLSNEGTEILCLGTPSSGELSQDWIAPGDTVLWSIPDTAENGDRFTVGTNDPDEPEFVLEVGYAEGLSVGDPAPDFTESDLDGLSWQLSELQGQVVFFGMLDGW
jgi:hypothetical protein